MTRREHPVTGHSTADIAAILAPRLPDASLERLTAQIATLKLLPAHAAGLVQYLRSHPDALTSGEATGPPALRALLDALAVEHPGVQRMRCHRCGAQRALPYRRDGGSICGGLLPPDTSQGVRALRGGGSAGLPGRQRHRVHPLQGSRPRTPTSLRPLRHPGAGRLPG